MSPLAHTHTFPHPFLSHTRSLGFFCRTFNPACCLPPLHCSTRTHLQVSLMIIVSGSFVWARCTNRENWQTAHTRCSVRLDAIRTAALQHLKSGGGYWGLYRTRMPVYIVRHSSIISFSTRNPSPLLWTCVCELTEKLILEHIGSMQLRL